MQPQSRPYPIGQSVSPCVDLHEENDDHEDVTENREPAEVDHARTPR